jgi:hypothetical protein
MHTRATIPDILSKSHHGLRDSYLAAALYLHYHTCRTGLFGFPYCSKSSRLGLNLHSVKYSHEICIFVSEISKKCTLQTQKQ